MARFIGLLVLLTLAPLLIGVSYAADKIILTCASMVTFPIGRDRPGLAESLIIDLDRKTVTVAMRVFSITQITENYVSFEGGDNESSYKGGLDRVSGSGYVIWYLRSKLMLTDELACKRANPVF